MENERKFQSTNVRGPRMNGGGRWRSWEAGSRDELRGLAAESSSFQYPLLYASSAGVISVLLRDDVSVQLNLDKCIRVVCPGKFAVAVNGNGYSACIMHSQARIFQEENKVFSHFGEDKKVVIGSRGVLFALKGSDEAVLVSAETLQGAARIPASSVRFPSLNNDFTLTLFHWRRSGLAPAHCENIIRSAHYNIRRDGEIQVELWGVWIRQDPTGNVDVHSRPRVLHVSPTADTVQVRSAIVDMAVQPEGKSYVKRGTKRIHVSRSGIVVSDGNCSTAMDQHGKLLS